MLPDLLKREQEYKIPVKGILVKWIPEAGMYGTAMRVIKSNHPRFTEGTRFDFGFFQVATRDGYTIISIP